MSRMTHVEYRSMVRVLHNRMTTRSKDETKPGNSLHDSGIGFLMESDRFILTGCIRTYHTEQP